jgi:hypothetical protein
MFASLRSLAVLSAAFLLPVAAAGDDTRLAVKLSQLMEAGWKPSPTGVARAQEHFDEASKLAPADARVPYAMALVMLQNRKYDDAVGWLEETLAADSRNVPARRALVWTHVLTKQYPEALANMRLLAAQLSPERVPPLGQEEQESHAAFLGRVMGFLTGPAAGSITADRLAATEREIQKSLAPAALSALNEGRKQTLATFSQMQADLAQTREQAKADQAREHALLERKAKDDRAQVTESRDALNEKAKASKARYDAEEAQTLPMLNQLRDQLVRLQARYKTQFDELQSLNFEIDVTLDEAAREHDPGRVARLRLQADRLRGRARTVQQDLRELDASMGQIKARGQALENRLQAAAGRYQSESKQFNAEAARLQKQEKALAATERQLEQPVTGDTPKVTSLASRVKAFTTYEPPALDEERERLLASFRR